MIQVYAVQKFYGILGFFYKTFMILERTYADKGFFVSVKERISGSVTAVIFSWLGDVIFP
jgi:hypothetical protein